MQDNRRNALAGEAFDKGEYTKKLVDSLNLIPLKPDKGPIDGFKWDKDKRKGDLQSPYGWYGLICGHTSDYIQAIDVDCKYDQSGTLWNEYSSLIKEQSDVLNRCVIQTTVNKGYHIIFKCKKQISNTKLAERPDRKVLIETRGYGGYIAVHPSPGYEFINDKDPAQLDYISEDDLNILLDSAKFFDQKKPAVKKEQYTASINVTPFDDYNSRGDAFNILLSHGWNEVYQRGNKIALRRPDKNDGVSATWFNDDNIFYCFTTSTEFENDRGYNQAQVYTILEHNGDYSEASKSLMRAGYGSFVSNKPEPKKAANPFTYESFTSAVERGANMPPLKKMCGDLLLENTINIWFGDNGTAKTFVAMSISNDIANGKKPLVEFKNEDEPHVVIYHDYELTDRQLAARFNGFPFSENLIRGNIDYTMNLDDYDIGDLLIREIEGYAKEHSKVTVFVDNISVFDNLNLEDRREAGKLLRALNKLKKLYTGLTIVILAHTPKLEPYKPILKDHLAGSKQLQNLIDGIVGFGKAGSDHSLYYIKQLKQRGDKIEFHYENVITFCLASIESYILPQFRGYGFENELLQTPKEEQRKLRNKAIYEKYCEGVTPTQLAEDSGLSRQYIHKIIKEFDK
jgi:hypothetical protein